MENEKKTMNEIPEENLNEVSGGRTGNLAGLSCYCKSVTSEQKALVDSNICPFCNGVLEKSNNKYSEDKICSSCNTDFAAWLNVY